MFWMLIGCEISDNNIEPGESFFRIYDDNRFEASFIPIDVVQTSDQGYLILNGSRQETSDFIGVEVMKVDDQGEFVRWFTLPPNYVHPVANWLTINDTHYFFCMDETSLLTSCSLLMLMGIFRIP